METTDNVEVTAQDALTNAESSADNVTWDSEKYDAYQKSLPKRYWGHEKLKDIHSTEELVERVINPKTKAPEKYELGLGDGFGDVESVLRKADVSQEDAKALADAIKGRLPKRYSHEALMENYGADFEQAEKDFGKAVGKVLADERMREAFLEFKDNPAIFEFARIVGKNLGDSPNLDVRKEQVAKKGTGDVLTDLLTGKL